MYMAAHHIIWFQTIHKVIYMVWESTQNSKSAPANIFSFLSLAVIQVYYQLFERTDNKNNEKLSQRYKW